MAKMKRRKCNEISNSLSNCEKTGSQKASVIDSEPLTKKPKKTTFSLSPIFTTSKIRFILLVFSGLIYVNSLRCGFVYDDRRAILENRNVIQAGNWFQLLKDDFWGTPASNTGSHKSYRPLVTLSYKLQARLDNFLHVSLSNLYFSNKVESSFISSTEEPERNSQTIFDTRSDDAKDNVLLTPSGNNEPELPKTAINNAQVFDSAATYNEHPMFMSAFTYHFVNLLLHLCIVNLVFELSGFLLFEQSSPTTAMTEVKQTARVCSKPETTKLNRIEIERRKRQATTSTDVYFQATIENYAQRISEIKSVVDAEHETITLKRDQAERSYPTKCIIAAFLFASHPIHVESVTSLVGRAELMGALFGLLSFKSMMRRLESRSGSKPSSNLSHKFKILDETRHLCWTICFALLACLSKENSIAVIIINVVLVIWFAHRSQDVSKSDRKYQKEKYLSKIDLRALVAMFAVIIVFGCIRVAVMLSEDKSNKITATLFLERIFLPKFSHYDNPLALSEREFCMTHQNLLREYEQQETRFSNICDNQIILDKIRYQILLTRLYLPAFNLKLLLNPSELSYDWPLISIGLVKSALETRFLLAIGLYALLIWCIGPFMCRLSSAAANELTMILLRRLRCQSKTTQSCLRTKDETRVTSSVFLDGINNGSAISYRPDNQTPDSGYCDSVSGEKTGSISSSMSNEDDTGSGSDETNSVCSIDTSKSNDSGFIESQMLLSAEDHMHRSSSRLGQNVPTVNVETFSKPEVSALTLVGKRSKRARQRSLLSSYYQEDSIRILSKSKKKIPEKKISNEEDCCREKTSKDSLKQTARSPATTPSSRSNHDNNNNNNNNNDDDDLICWPLIWLTVPYLPASNVFISVGFLAAERSLYLPSFGFCLLVAHLIEVILKKAYDPNNGYFSFYKITEAQTSECQQKPHRKYSFLTFGVKKKTQTTTTRKAKLDSSKQNLLLNQKSTIKLALVMPLIIFGSLRTIQRNRDWLNEYTLYSSNVVQSPAKSIANLASIGQDYKSYFGSVSSTDNFNPIIESYRRALELEPHSADLHYNLALVMHRKLLSETSTVGLERSKQAIGFEHGHRRPITSAVTDDVTVDRMNRMDQIEYHYKTAIGLRANFPMAALSLGAYQWLYLGQLDEAERTFVVQCANRMDPGSSKTYLAFVQAQIECLISGAKLYTTHSNRLVDEKTTTDTIDDGEAAVDTIRRRQPTLAQSNRQQGPIADAQFKQTNTIVDVKQTNNNKQGREGSTTKSIGDHSIDPCPVRVLEWMQSARTKASQIDAADTRILSMSLIQQQQKQQGSVQSLPFGDLNKQLASINWLEARCLREALNERQQQQQASEEKQFSLLADAVERYAWSSLSPIDSSIYIDYAKAVLKFASAQKLSASSVLKRSFEIELAKLHGQKSTGQEVNKDQIEDLIRLLRFTGKISPRIALDGGKMLSRIASGFRLDSKFDLLTLVAEMAFEVGDNISSEFYYKLALDELTLSQANGSNTGSKRRNGSKKLATAHVNYGAILQINGKLSEAHNEFKQAVECDRRNQIAKRNLASIQKQLQLFA